MLRRRLLATSLSVVLVGFALSPTGTAPARSAPPPPPTEPATIVLDWERTLMTTVYGEAPPPTPPRTGIPVGVPLLGYTSGAMYDGLKRAARVGGSQSAAVARAAHDVLLAYFPADVDALGDQLDAVGRIPDGSAETRGVHAGAAAARAMVSRVEDPRLNPDGIVYDKAAAPGIWPATTASFLAPWLGFMDTLVVHRPIRVDGPDPIGSAAYAFDYQEVKNVGASESLDPDRTDHQTETAVFFNSNSATMLGLGLVGLLEDDPLTLRQTARLFAVMHGAMTDSVITCWRLKYNGFWRPFQAIHHVPGDPLTDDRNPATVPDPDWTPLINPNPPYPDYVSGHACLTAPAAETIRQVLGEETPLELASASTGTSRVYDTISEIEFDAFHARIWGGLHFRDAMEDGYLIGHTAARRALAAIN